MSIGSLSLHLSSLVLHLSYYLDPKPLLSLLGSISFLAVLTHIIRDCGLSRLSSFLFRPTSSAIAVWVDFLHFCFDPHHPRLRFGSILFISIFHDPPLQSPQMSTDQSKCSPINAVPPETPNRSPGR